MTNLEMCIEVLKDVKKPLHLNDLAPLVIDKINLTEERNDPEGFKKRISAALSNHAKKKDSCVVRVKNKKGKDKRGVYKAKITRKKDVPEPVPEVSTLYTGKAGEYALLSELLFRGFNASIMTVDEGVDVVASYQGKYFHLQVKTSNENKSGKYQFQIKDKAYKNNDTSSTFYAFIMRRYFSGRWRSDYVIMSSTDIRKYLQTGVIKDGAQYSLQIEFDREKCMLNGRKDISWYLNRFDILR